MIIKQSSTAKRIIKDFLLIIKNKKFLKITLLSSFTFLIILSSISFGIFLNRNEKIDSVVHLGGDLLENKFSFIKNYFSSFSSNSNLFIIDIKFKHLDKINNLVNIASDNGYISENLKVEEFPANITLNNKKYRVKLSLTGQYLDHIESDRNSFNVEVKDDHTIMGMSKFKLLIPSTRGYLADWVGHEMQKNEGLIVPRFDFIKVKINGEYKGIYAIEESYNTDLIEYNNFRDGIIFKPNLNNITILNKKKIDKDVNLLNRSNSLKNLWKSFLNDEIPAENIFDLEKFAIDYATTDLISGLHSKFTLNLRYYYNPITNLIEPISREFGFLRNSFEIVGKSKTKLFIQSLYENSELSESDKILHNKFFNNLTFKKLYFKHLDRISKPSYLDSFFNAVKNKMLEKEKIIYNESPYYSYPKRFLYENQNTIKDFFKQADGHISANLNVQNNDISLKFSNRSLLPIKINHIVINDSIISEPINDSIILSNNSINNESKTIAFDSLKDQNININNAILYYHILGLDDRILKLRITKINNSFISFNPTTMSKSFLDLDFISINTINNIITIKKGDYEIDRLYSIPKGYTVNFEAGTNINLIENGGLISYSKLNFKGNSELPIVFTSSSLSNSGLSLINVGDKSSFNYVNIDNLSNFSSDDWNLTGSLTFYKSDVIFNNCKISNNISGDDLLNIFKSDFEIHDSDFHNSFADALDADFCKGKIVNTTFYNSGNDAIDISGTNLFLENILIDKSLDKALSAGENSKINGSNIKIINSEIAVCSKDLSLIDINNFILKNNKIGITAFQKKSKFGPGYLNLFEGMVTDNEIDYLIEQNSIAYLNNNFLVPNDGNLKDQFYGVKYGKSSK